MQSFKGSQSGPVVCRAVTVNVDPPNLAAGAGIYTVVAIPSNPGCVVGQKVLVNPAAQILTAYGVTDYWISAANTVQLHFANWSGGALDPGALNFDFVIFGAIGAV